MLKSYLSAAVNLAACIAFLVLFIQVRDQAAAGRQAHVALCVFRGDLEHRVLLQQAQVQATRDFLRNNPQGIPGIPIQLLRQSLENQLTTLRNQRATLVSLDDLKC